jgi:hypothetical protein
MTNKPLKSAISYEYLKPSLAPTPKKKEANKTPFLSATALKQLDTASRVEKQKSPPSLNESDALDSVADAHLLGERNAEISQSLQNDFDEIRELLKNTAILFNESAKFHLEQTKQITEIINLIKLSEIKTNEKLDRIMVALAAKIGESGVKKSENSKKSTVSRQNLSRTLSSIDNFTDDKKVLKTPIKTKKKNSYEEV